MEIDTTGLELEPGRVDIALKNNPNLNVMVGDITNEEIVEKIGKSFDLILMTNFLFQCEDKKAVLEEAKKILKPGGRILIVDWEKDNPATKEIEKLSFGEIEVIANELSFKLEKEFEAGKFHRALIFIK